MNMTFLGTSAAPSMPIPFCLCDVCKSARETRGRDLRRRSSVLIGDDLMIDIGPDSATASFEFDVDLSRVRVCLLTHAHEDHFDPEFLMARHAEYNTVVAEDIMIVGSSQTLHSIDETLGRRSPYGSIYTVETQEALHLQPVTIEPFESSTVRQYCVTAFPAVHGSSGSLLYSVEYDGSALFYGTDTSVLTDEVWNHLHDRGVSYDWIVLDHTHGIGFDSTPGGHLASKDVARYAQRFRSDGILKPDGSVYATHISHEGYLQHEEYSEYAEAHGYKIPFDGLRLSTC